MKWTEGEISGIRRVEFERSKKIHQIILLPYLKGLKREGVRVIRGIKELNPTAIAFNISPEELKGLKRYVKDRISEMDPENLSISDKIYYAVLKNYGEVSYPSPALVESLIYAKKEGIQVYSVDINEQEYTDLYLKHIGFISHMRRERYIRKVLNLPLPSDSVEKALILVDRYLSRQRGVKRMEMERVKSQVKKVLKLSKGEERLIFLQEIERFSESLSRLRKELDEKRYDYRLF